MAPERDPYRVLGVDQAADHEVIAAAYRVLARRHHPDVSQSEDAERRMAEINAAWAILRDEETRAAWDREHTAAARGGGNASAPVPQGWRSGSTAPSGGSGPDTSYARDDEETVVHTGRPTWRRGPNGQGAAGPPPGQPSGAVLPFGRHIGWSLGEVARVDPGYLSWLANRAEGAPYRAEIEAILKGGASAPSPLGSERRRWTFRG